jgi:hypothetical protein
MVDFQAGLTGTILLTTGELLIDKDLTIAGPGADVITVSGNHASRVFNLVAFTTTVAISGLTIADGNAPDSGGGIQSRGTLTLTGCTLSGNSAEGSFGGGGIRHLGGALTITASTLSGNTASQGGGIMNGGALTVTASTFSGNAAQYGGGGIDNGGTLTVSASTLSGNSAQSDGGGIVNFSGRVTVVASTLSGNTAHDGGGIWSYGFNPQPMLTVTASTLGGNSAQSDGGGIYAGSGPVTVTASTVSDNAAEQGGGLYNYESEVTVTASTLSGNWAQSDGAGIYAYDGGVTVSASTLSGDVAQASGGGIHNFSSVVTVTASTLSGNSAQSDGGGIYNDFFGTLTVTGSTLSGNAAQGSGGGVYNSPLSFGMMSLRNTITAGNAAPAAPDVDGPLSSEGHNLIGDGTGSSGYDPTDLVGTSADPIDPRLGPLQFNGGPTQTMALLPDSPAIDAGDNTGAPMWDQRGPGFPRIIHGIIDIGAFEYRPAVQLDPNPVPISEPGPTTDTMQPGFPASQPTLDLAVEALATAVPVQSHSTVYPVPLSLRAFVHDSLFAERSEDPLLAGWEEN